MRKVAFAGIICASLFAAQTQAAPPVSNWTGFYIGVNGGYGWGHEVATTLFSTVLSTAGTQTPGNPDGFLGGVQAGYNYQFAPNWVFGMEADFDFASLKASTTIPGNLPTSVLGGSTNVHWITTGTARVGYAWDSWLLYAKGGVAVMRAEYSAYATFGGVLVEQASLNVNRSGYTAGLGIERMLSRNWSARAEWDYLDFGTERILFTFPGVGSNGADVSAHIHVFRVGLNYFIRPQ